MLKRRFALALAAILAVGVGASGVSAQEKKEVGKPTKLKVAFALLSTIHDLG